MKNKNKHLTRFSTIIMLIGIMIFSYSCYPEIEDSPNPGILLVTLQSDNTDTTLVIADDTLTVKQFYNFSFIVDSTVDLSYISDNDTIVYTIDSIAVGIVSDQVTFLIDDHSLSIVNDLLVISGSVIDTSLILSDEETFVFAGDTIKVSKNYEMTSIKVSIFQGKIYNDSLYAILYTDTSVFTSKDKEYNLLAKTQGSFKRYTIFKSYVPPGNYNMLEFGFTASELSLGVYRSPITLPENENVLVGLFGDFTVKKGGVTEIQLQVRSLESMARYRDSFIFNRIIEILDIVQ